MKQVIIERFGTRYMLREESGQLVEGGFRSMKEARQWAADNGYDVVPDFFLTAKK